MPNADSDLLNRVISSLESTVLDEIVRRQERNEPLNPADLSESIGAAITEMLSEALLESGQGQFFQVSHPKRCKHAEYEIKFRPLAPGLTPSWPKAD